MARQGDTRRLALAPEDWFWATWRDLKPLPSPKPPPFDREAALERLRRVRTDGWDFEQYRLRAMTPEEAAFRLQAMRLASDAEFANTLRYVQSLPDELLSPEQARRLKKLADEAASRSEAESFPDDPAPLLLEVQCWLYAGLWPALRALYPASRLVAALLAVEGRLDNRWDYEFYTLPALIEGFRTRVLPFLSPAELEACREAVIPYLKGISWPAGRGYPPLSLLFAAVLGIHDAVRPAVEGLGDGPPPMAMEIIFGLGSATEVEEHVRRLTLRIHEPEHARAWLAHTEFGALDWLKESIQAEKRSGDAAALARVLALAHAPEVAPVMLEVMQKSRAAQPARKWMEGNPEHAAAGLVGLCEERGRVLEGALQVLRGLHAAHPEVVEAALREGGRTAQRLRETLTGASEDAHPPFDPAVLGEELAGRFGQAPEALPKWLAGQELPPLLVEGRRFSAEQLGVLYRALREGTLQEAHPLVTALRERAESLSRDRFALRLLELWHWAGMPRREIWALHAAGLLGGDGCAMRLGPLAVEWRKKLNHQLAKDAIDCLKVIGSDTALLQLRNFTRVPRDWSLKETAEGYLKEAAEARGLTLAELDERMVPDCGLDPRGARTFDYGARRFTLALGPGGKPMVKEEGGKLRPDLPKPTAKDDPALAEAALGAWKLLKKQLGEVLKAQTRRLEAAMVSGKRWTRADLETLIVGHPVMILPARHLIWAAYDTGGAMTATFRVAEDGSLADVDDEPFHLPESAEVGIPHPIHLSPELRSAWGERVGDYELSPPFPQLGRPLYAPEPEEVEQREITRFNEIPCLPMALVDGLERRGWLRDTTDGSGYLCAHTREFASGVTALAEYGPGIAVWNVPGADLQAFGHVAFYQGTARKGEPLPLGKVDPLAFSEVTADLTAVTARTR